MASITIRSLDESLKSKLRIRAAEHGRSMEAEAREILRMGLSTTSEPELNLAESIRRLFDPLGPFELELPPRQLVGDPPSFTE
jgi:plasmid stability protein